MATTRRVTVTATPTDVVAGQSLGIGTYTIQNLSQQEVYVVARDAAVVDPTTLLGEGNVLDRRGYPNSVGTLSVEAATDTLYLYAQRIGVQQAFGHDIEAVVAITEAP